MVQLVQIRVAELEEVFQGCKAELIFITAFPDFVEFRRHLAEIAWDTEVWVSEIPDHMIHFNGDKFLGPCLSNTGMKAVMQRQVETPGSRWGLLLRCSDLLTSRPTA